MSHSPMIEIREEKRRLKDKPLLVLLIGFLLGTGVIIFLVAPILPARRHGAGTLALAAPARASRPAVSRESLLSRLAPEASDAPTEEDLPRTSILEALRGRSRRDAEQLPAHEPGAPIEAAPRDPDATGFHLPQALRPSGATVSGGVAGTAVAPARTKTERARTPAGTAGAMTPSGAAKERGRLAAFDAGTKVRAPGSSAAGARQAVIENARAPGNATHAATALAAIPAVGGSRDARGAEAGREDFVIGPGDGNGGRGSGIGGGRGGATPPPEGTEEKTKKADGRFSFEDTSTGNGTVALRVAQKITGAGVGLLACTAQATGFVVGPSPAPCSKPSDFVLLKNQEGWTYDPGTDTYSINADVKDRNWPHTRYVTTFILTDGRRETVDYAPRLDAAPPKTNPAPPPAAMCQWSGFVAGPVPSPTAACGPANVGAHAKNPDYPQYDFTCVCP